MQSGKIYRITKRIKLHTKPLYEANVTVIGRYIRESENGISLIPLSAKKIMSLR